MQSSVLRVAEKNARVCVVKFTPDGTDPPVVGLNLGFLSVARADAGVFTCELEERTSPNVVVLSLSCVRGEGTVHHLDYAVDAAGNTITVTNNLVAPDVSAIEVTEATPATYETVFDDPDYTTTEATPATYAVGGDASQALTPSDEVGEITLVVMQILDKPVDPVAEV